MLPARAATKRASATEYGSAKVPLCVISTQLMVTATGSSQSSQFAVTTAWPTPVAVTTIESPVFTSGRETQFPLLIDHVIVPVAPLFFVAVNVAVFVFEP